jgi:DNA topoisomerase-3
MSILLIVEKVKVAQVMAEAFNWTRIPNGFEGQFEGKKIICIPLRGHVITYDEPQNIMPGISWDSMDNLLPIPRTLQKVRIPDDPADRMPISVYYNNVERNIKVASEVILGTDCDAEGEYIGWELIQHFNFKGRVRRAWLAGGLDVETMRYVMANLKEPHIHKGMAYAAESRSQSDYIYQLLTRAYTYYARRGKYGSNLGAGSARSSVMSVGRVQSPVVGMIVERERRILDFVPVTHFKISADFTIPSDEGVVINGNYTPVYESGASEKDLPGITWNIDFNSKGEVVEKPMFTDKSIISQFEHRLRASAHLAKVIEYKEQDKKEYPKKTFNTSEAMMEIAKACKVSASVGQHIIEDLYEQGYVSYPRTTKQDLPISIYESQRNELFASIIKINEFSSQTDYIKDLHNGKNSQYKAFRPKVYIDEDMPHYGLIPTLLEVNDSTLANMRPVKKDEKQKVPHTGPMMALAYKIIVKRFIVAHYPPAVFATQEIKFVVPVEDLFGNPESYFTATGRRVKDPGFMAAFKDPDAKNKDTIMQALKKGQAAHYAKLLLSESTTEPPKRYTEDDLPVHMEKINLQIKDPKWRKILAASEGIGTPATRKKIVETILYREYVEIKDKKYYPTKKGFDFYDNVEEWMVRPEYTAMWEDQLRKMYTITDESVNKKISADFVEENIAKIEGLIQGLINKFGKAVEYSEDRKSGPKELTPKMILAIKRIFENKREPVPRELLKDPAAASAFLDKEITAMRERRALEGDGPSEKQKEMVEKLIQRLGSDYPVPEDVLTNRVSCSAFIDAAMKISPPSEKQLALARKLAEKLPENERPPEKVFAIGTECSKFIDKQMKKSAASKSSAGSASGAKPKAGTGGKPPVKKAVR